MTSDNYWDQQDPQATQQFQQSPYQQPQPQQYQQYQQPQYQQPQQYQQPRPFTQPPETTSLGSWVLTLFLAAIPIVGLVLLFVWAFGSTPDESKKNWARANLIWILIAIVVYVLLAVVAGVSFTSLYSNGLLS